MGRSKCKGNNQRSFRVFYSKVSTPPYCCVALVDIYAFVKNKQILSISLYQYFVTSRRLLYKDFFQSHKINFNEEKVRHV